MKVGDRLGKYRLTRPLGGGAMGVVWAALNEDTHKEVALKLLPSPNEELRRRLLREAKACGRLEHRNIVTIYDTGTAPNGEPFLVMQLLTGETLASRLERVGRLPPVTAAAMGAAIASGLGAAHAENIIHRDLKPANVFLHRERGSAGEVVKILDFGVSRIELVGDASGTATGMLIGSPTYMSPEQARGTRLDPRSDIWSLGVVLFEMLTGARPFQGQTIADAIVQVLTAPIPRVEVLAPGVPPDLSALVASCLTRERDQRPAAAAQIADQLLTFASSNGGYMDLGLSRPEPTSLLPHFASTSLERANHDDQDDDRRKTVPVPPARGAGPHSTMLVAPPAAAPVAALAVTTPLIPAQGAQPSSSTTPLAPTPSATASSSTTPLTRAEIHHPSPLPRPASSRPQRHWMALAIIGTLSLAGVLVLVLERRRAAETTEGATPSSAALVASSGPTSSAASEPEAPVVAITATATADPGEPPPEPSQASSQQAPAISRGTGELRINSIPISKVVLDGKPLGSTPKLGIMVPAGPHTVTFIYQTGQRQTKSIIVKPGASHVVADRLADTSLDRRF